VRTWYNKVSILRTPCGCDFLPDDGMVAQAEAVREALDMFRNQKEVQNMAGKMGFVRHGIGEDVIIGGRNFRLVTNPYTDGLVSLQLFAFSDDGSTATYDGEEVPFCALIRWTISPFKLDAKDPTTLSPEEFDFARTVFRDMPLQEWEKYTDIKVIPRHSIKIGKKFRRINEYGIIVQSK
jgi:hypothetical protein